MPNSTFCVTFCTPDGKPLVNVTGICSFEEAVYTAEDVLKSMKVKYEKVNRGWQYARPNAKQGDPAYATISREWMPATKVGLGLA